ncbi:MAG: putative motility protein [Clostridiales bacterium]|nr:putative motility protein [Clostridiales bacterium]
MILSIASYATAYKQAEIQNNVSFAMLKNILNSTEQSGENVTEMLKEMPAADNLGNILDIRA